MQLKQLMLRIGALYIGKLHLYQHFVDIISIAPQNIIQSSVF